MRASIRPTSGRGGNASTKASEYASIAHATSSAVLHAAAAAWSQRPSGGGGASPRRRASTRTNRSPRSTSRKAGTSSRNCRSRSSAQARSTASRSNGPSRSAIASAVTSTTPRSPGPATGTSVLPKSNVTAAPASWWLGAGKIRSAMPLGRPGRRCRTSLSILPSGNESCCGRRDAIAGSEPKGKLPVSIEQVAVGEISLRGAVIP